MYADLNIPWPTTHLAHLLQSPANSRKGKQKASNPSSAGGQLDVWQGVSAEDKQSLRETVECAIKLGYSIIAFNLIVPQNLDPALLAPYFPFTPDNPPFPDLDPRTTPGKNGFGSTVLQLSRLTMVMDESVAAGGKGVFGFSASQAGYLSNYSLLSVIPLDAAAFSHACLSLSAPTPTAIDLITFDLASSPKLRYHMPLSTVSHALKQNVHFELVYGPTTSASRFASYSSSNFPVSASSASCRKNLVSGAKELIRVTKCGKGLVISSAAGTWSELRAPDDLVNFTNILGLSHEFGKRAITMNPKSVVSKAISARQTHKGVISNPVVVVTTYPTTESTATATMTEAHGDMQSNQHRKRTLPSSSSSPPEPAQTLSGENFPTKKRIKT